MHLTARRTFAVLSVEHRNLFRDRCGRRSWWLVSTTKSCPAYAPLRFHRAYRETAARGMH